MHGTGEEFIVSLVQKLEENRSLGRINLFGRMGLEEFRSGFGLDWCGSERGQWHAALNTVMNIASIKSGKFE
jgi:hypothetical protein